jgi:hypothetical protein
MDFSILLSVPFIAIAVSVVLFTALIGHAIGRNNELRRKEAALAEANTRAQVELEGQRTEHLEQMEVLNKAHAGDQAQLKQEHEAQVAQASQAHQALVDSLKNGHAAEIERLGSEHSALIDRLNGANIANINALKAEQEKQVAQIGERADAQVQAAEQRRTSEVQALKEETAATVAELKKDQQSAIQAMREDHGQALSTLRQDSQEAIRQAEQERDRRIGELQQRHAAEQAALEGRLAVLGEERDRLQAEAAQLTATVAGLEQDIKEARLQNMFSVSKSGEKLVRVVRSVQELASELDETSRAVTGGEYSVFEAIKDQRDKDAVLSLTGSGAGGEHHDQAEMDESAIEGETDPAADLESMEGAAGDDQSAAEETPLNFSEDKSADPKLQH